MPTLELGEVDASLDVMSITCRRAIARAERWRASAVVARSSRGMLASRIAGALEKGGVEAKLSWKGNTEFVTRGTVVGAWFDEDARRRLNEDRLVVDMQRTSFEPRETSPFVPRWRVHPGRTLADVLRGFSDIVALPVAMTNELARTDITHLPGHEAGHVLQCGESDWEFLCMLLRRFRHLRPSMQVTLGSVHAAPKERGHWKVVPGSVRQLREWGMDGDSVVDVEREFRIAETLAAFDARSVMPSVRASDDMAIAVPIWRFIHEKADVEAWSAWIERELPLIRGSEGGMITVQVADAGDGRFKLSVRDTGVGIAEEDKSVIFQKFRQSRKVLDGEGLTREFAGTGLGLSIVKELAKLLGGEVDFDSELGRGSSFWVTLPWRLSEGRSLQLMQPPVPASQPSTAGSGSA